MPISLCLRSIACLKTRDNGRMPMVPTGLVHQTQLANEIAKAVRKLGKEVVRVNYTLGTDSTGEPSIFFRIVLTDAASREDNLAEVTGRIETILVDEIRPYKNWGLLPYFSFRSKSEQQKRNDPEWV
jgi:hypothetical protein